MYCERLDSTLTFQKPQSSTQEQAQEANYTYPHSFKPHATQEQHREKQTTRIHTPSSHNKAGSILNFHEEAITQLCTLHRELTATGNSASPHKANQRQSRTHQSIRMRRAAYRQYVYWYFNNCSSCDHREIHKAAETSTTSSSNLKLERRTT